MELRVRFLSMVESKKRYQEWCEGEDVFAHLPQDYGILRENLICIYNHAKENAEKKSEQMKSKAKFGYYIDVFFGVSLFEFLDKQQWFTERLAANPDFWRYLCVMTIPDILRERLGDHAEDRYYRRTTRIYLLSIWWYVFFSYRKSLEYTRTILLSSNMNTDILMNLVDRSGRYGAYVEVYREIMFNYACLKSESLEKYFTNGQKGLIRSVMKLNTAKLQTVDPIFYKGGVSGYVHQLYIELGLKSEDWNRRKKR